MADINIGTADAPLMVPEGSAGYENYKTNIVNQTPSIDSLNTQKSLDVGSTLPTGTVDTASAVVAGASQTSKSIQDYIKELTPPKTDTQTKADALTEDISKLTSQDTGKTQAQVDAESAAGVTTLKKQLVDLNAQILSKNASYDATNTAVEGQAIPMNLIIGQQAQVRKQQASEIGMLQARAQGLQGQIGFAQDTANRAVDLKYSTIEDELKVKQAQLALLQPTLSKEEAVQAAALNRQYADQQKQIQDKKDLEKSNVALALSVKADPSTFDKIQNAKTAVEASRIATQFTQQQNNIQVIHSAGVTTPYAEVNGEVQDAKTGVGFTDPKDFQTKTGMTLAQAQAKGLITSIKPLTEAKNTEVVTVGGKKILINSQTGATIKVIGASGSDTGTGTGTGTDSSGKKYTVASAAQEVKSLWDTGYIQGNGKISSTDYKKTKAWWVQQKLKAVDFDNQFSYLIDQSGKTWKADYGYKGN